MTEKHLYDSNIKCFLIYLKNTMNQKTKNNQLLKIVYRQFYYLWRKISGILFVYYLRQTKFKTASRKDLLANQQKYKIYKFGSEETVIFGDFYTPKPICPRIAKKIYRMKEKIIEPFVLELEPAEIIGNYPVAFDRGRNLILETTLPRFSDIETHIAKNVSLKTILASQLGKQDEQKPIEVACILTNPWSNNFWHWTVDTLTQLEGVEYYQQQTGIKPKLIVESNLRAWQRDSLEILGYKGNDLIYWQDFRRTVNKLVVPSFRRSYESNIGQEGIFNCGVRQIHGEISVNACQWLKQKMLSNIDFLESDYASFSPQVFISRRKALGRRISNENEVLKSLKPLGFAEYILEEMSYLEQVKLFALAKVIIAPHGAGLTNFIFAENPIVLELFGAYVGREFANLARGMGFKYGCLACPPPLGEVRQKDGDMLVDVKQMQNLLDMMQNNKQ